MEFFQKNRIVILRGVGGLLLIASFFLYFWDTSQKQLTPNEIAAANVARMEVKSVHKSSAKEQEHSKFLQHLKAKQEKNLRYLLIFCMLFGFGFLGYSFIQRD